MTDQASACFLISGMSFSRVLALSFLESVSAASSWMGLSGSMHAAIEMGPQQAPRPASSTPATGPSPLRDKVTSKVRRCFKRRIEGGVEKRITSL